MTGKREWLISAMPRVAFIGSRSFPDAGYYIDLEIARIPAGGVVISGGARGVDALAEQAAREFKLHVISYRPERQESGRWAVRKYGDGDDLGLMERDGFPLTYASFTDAAKSRNWLIVNDSERVVALWDGMSGGTAHGIAAAARAKKPTAIHLLGDS